MFYFFSFSFFFIFGHTEHIYNMFFPLLFFQCIILLTTDVFVLSSLLLETLCVGECPGQTPHPPEKTIIYVLAIFPYSPKQHAPCLNSQPVTVDVLFKEYVFIEDPNGDMIKEVDLIIN